MIWVQRIIWVVLTLFSISVIYIVFSGGVVKDDEEGPEGQPPGASSGSMAYDRYLPGERQGQPLSPKRP